MTTRDLDSARSDVDGRAGLGESPYQAEVRRNRELLAAIIRGSNSKGSKVGGDEGDRDPPLVRRAPVRLSARRLITPRPAHLGPPSLPRLPPPLPAHLGRPAPPRPVRDPSVVYPPLRNIYHKAASTAKISPAAQAYCDRRRYFRESGERDHELEAQQERDRQTAAERRKPLYLCDQSAVRIMVKAVTDGPSPLGAWVHQQLAAGALWARTPVDGDAFRGWKVFSPDPSLADYGAPRIVKLLFKRVCVAASDVDAVDDPELYDAAATYLGVHSFLEGATFDMYRRAVTANRRFERVFLGTEERRAATLRAIFGLSYVFRTGSGPVVLFVDDVHQEQPECLPFQEEDVREYSRLSGTLAAGSP